MAPEQSKQVNRHTQPREQRPRRYLMCRPTYFQVVSALNPWMHPDQPVDTALAIAQWELLRQTYTDLSHQVELIDPVPGLPDMVFAANGGIVIDGRAMGVSFVHPERQPESGPYLARLRDIDPDAVAPTVTNEGEGDVLLVGDTILAGYGFRNDRSAGQEIQEFFGRPVIDLHLIDPRFYHLDTALTVLSDSEIAYLPSAFTPGSRRVLERMFPDAVIASERDAVVFGLNAVSDGLNVVVSAEATGFIDALGERGFKPWGVEMSELRKAGGGAKCCTLELRY